MNKFYKSIVREATKESNNHLDGWNASNLSGVRTELSMRKYGSMNVEETFIILTNKNGEKFLFSFRECDTPVTLKRELTRLRKRLTRLQYK